MKIVDLTSRHRGLGRQVEVERRARDHAMLQLEAMQRALEEVVQHIQHPKDLKRGIIDMYRRHGQTTLHDSPVANPEHEFERLSIIRMAHEDAVLGKGGTWRRQSMD